MSFLPEHADDDVMSEINMTPLIDVMLVLLVVFILAVPAIQSAVPLTLPRASAAAPQQPADPVRLDIDAQGQTYWNGKAMSDDESDETDDRGTPRSDAGSGWSDATDHLGGSENNSPGRSFSANETELQLSPIKTLHISTSPPTPAPPPRVMSRNALATRKSIARRPKSSDVDGEAKSERESDNGEGDGDVII
jgi:hypothetical protein